LIAARMGRHPLYCHGTGNQPLVAIVVAQSTSQFRYQLGVRKPRQVSRSAFFSDFANY
jgi:hypothetical protein